MIATNRKKQLNATFSIQNNGNCFLNLERQDMQPVVAVKEVSYTSLEVDIPPFQQTQLKE